MEQRTWPRELDQLKRSAIQVRVPTIDRLFNPIDPSPIHERSLNVEVADWIEEWAEDLDRDLPIEVEVHVTSGSTEGREDAVISGIHNHFEYREWQLGRQLHKLLREGRLSLVIGLIALTAFTTAARIIGPSDDTFVEVVHEGLAVLGWVSMWKPLELLLYDWWPIRRERRVCLRLAEATVVFRDQRSATGD
jgi:hypothetical protein